MYPKVLVRETKPVEKLRPEGSDGIDQASALGVLWLCESSDCLSKQVSRGVDRWVVSLQARSGLRTARGSLAGNKVDWGTKVLLPWR